MNDDLRAVIQDMIKESFDEGADLAFDTVIGLAHKTAEEYKSQGFEQAANGVIGFASAIEVMQLERRAAND